MERDRFAALTALHVVDGSKGLVDAGTGMMLSLDNKLIESGGAAAGIPISNPVDRQVPRG